MKETCAICGCVVHRRGDYGLPTVGGRSHATIHHYVAERFFGRSRNRPNTNRDGVFETCPWGVEGESGVFCFECHEELLHNPVLLPDDIALLARLVASHRLSERKKPAHRRRLAGRILLLQEALAAGLRVLARRAKRGAK